MMKKTQTLSFVLSAIGNASIATLCALTAGCGEKEARATSSADDETKPNSDQQATSGKAEDQTQAAINVEVLDLAPMSLSEVASANGTAQAVNDITYSAELPGKIEYLPIKIGDRVSKGRVLARIDFQTLSAQAAQAEAGYQLSKTTADRLAALESDDIVSKQRMDEVRTQLASAESQRAIMQTQLSKATVKADKPGVIANVFVERSEFVGPGTPIAQVVNLSEMILIANLPETQIARVGKGASVQAEFDALNETFTGEVEAIVPSASKESKTFAVRVKVKNSNERILVGMSARVRISLQELENIIAVPQSAVIEEPQGRAVYVAVNGRASRRPVELGAVDGDRVVITNGVQPGDKLIVVGQRDLSDGQAITVVK